MATISIHPIVQADLDRFSAEHHRHLTVLEAPRPVITGSNVFLTGWKLWCLNCGLQGEYVFDTVYEAKSIADNLRSEDEPQCRHDQPRMKESL